jgi:hypothetical protein
LATFNKEPAPQDFIWGIQWKNWLSRQFANLLTFFEFPEFPAAEIGELVVEQDALINGSLQVEEDFSAEDGAFSGELTVAEDISAGGMIRGENSPIRVGPITLSGSSMVLTASSPVPIWAGKIVFMFNSVSLSGTANSLIQFGPTSTPVATGYSSSAVTCADAANPQVASSVAGFIIRSAIAASMVDGVYTFHLADPITHSWAGSLGYTRDTNRGCAGGGTLTSMTGPLLHITLTTTGADTFDGGTVTLRYEY